MNRFTLYLAVIFCCISFSQAESFQPFSVNDTCGYKAALVYGDSKVNNNGMIDCYDEFIFALEFIINQPQNAQKSYLQAFLSNMKARGLEIEVLKLITTPGCIKQVETPQLIKYSRIPDNIEQLIGLRSDLHKSYEKMDSTMDIFFKKLEDYNSRGLKLVRKLNEKHKENYIKLKATMRDLEYGSSAYNNPTNFQERSNFGDGSDPNYHYQGEYNDLIQIIPMFNSFEYYKDMLNYIIEGRRIFREKMELFNLEKELRIYDSKLDFTAQFLLTRDSLMLFNNGKYEVAAKGREENDIQAIDYIPTKELKALSKKIDEYSQKKIPGNNLSDINKKLYAIYQLDSTNQFATKLLNKKIEKFNKQAENYNSNNAKIKKMLKKNTDKLNKLIEQQMNISNDFSIGAKLKGEMRIWKHLTEIDASKLDFFKSYKETLKNDLDLNDLNNDSKDIQDKVELIKANNKKIETLLKSIEQSKSELNK